MFFGQMACNKCAIILFSWLIPAMGFEQNECLKLSCNDANICGTEMLIDTVITRELKSNLFDSFGELIGEYFEQNRLQVKLATGGIDSFRELQCLTVGERTYYDFKIYLFVNVYNDENEITHIYYGTADNLLQEGVGKNNSLLITNIEFLVDDSLSFNVGLNYILVLP